MKYADPVGELGPQSPIRYLNVVIGLRVQPEPWFHAEEQAESKRGIRRDGAPAIHHIAGLARWVRRMAPRTLEVTGAGDDVSTLQPDRFNSERGDQFGVGESAGPFFRPADCASLSIVACGATRSKSDFS